MSVTLTVYFDEPFYAGLIERVEDGCLSACKTVFGPEPSDAQVMEWLQAEYFKLRFSPPVEGAKEKPVAANPKRRQRQAAQAGANPAVKGTKSQQALALAREEGKQARKERTKAQREEEQARKLQLRQEKKKEKHRGH